MIMLKQAIAAILLVVGATAFAPVTTTAPSRRAGPLHAQRERPSDLGLARFFGLVATVSALSFGNVQSSEAAPKVNDFPFSSSSLEIAETIRILDMSMPSYGEISDYKASVENVKSLSVDPATVQGMVGPKSKRAPSSSSSSSSSSSAKNPAASFLPSMNKQSAAAKNAEKKSSMPEYDL